MRQSIQRSLDLVGDGLRSACFRDTPLDKCLVRLKETIDRDSDNQLSHHLAYCFSPKTLLVIV